MSFNRFAAAIVAFAIGAGTLAAQHTMVLNVNGGGYNHLSNLNTTGLPTADFKPGFNLGASLGSELNRYVAVHADFSFTQAKARGISTFSGANINRYFYGAHLEVRYPTATGVTPFAFAGGGAVTVVQVNGATVPTFTKPAGMMGLGVGYQIPGSQVEVFSEGKTLVYQWNAAGFDKTMWDFTYSIGLAYRFPF